MGRLFLLAAVAYCDYGQCRAGVQDVVGYGYEGLVDDSTPLYSSVSAYCGRSGIRVNEH